jgi:hypothetical protein
MMLLTTQMMTGAFAEHRIHVFFQMTVMFVFVEMDHLVAKVVELHIVVFQEFAKTK